MPKLVLLSKITFFLALPVFAGKLHYAAETNDVALAKKLLKNGADPNEIARHADYTPLDFAALNDSFEVAKLLIQFGAMVNGSPTLYSSPLSNCVKGNSLSTAKLLLKHGADINWTGNKAYWPPLGEAVLLKNITMARFFIEEGADVFLYSDLIHMAAQSGFVPMVELLIKNGFSDLERKNKKGNPPLHVAINNRANNNSEQLNMVKYLVSKGAKLESKGYGGMTPLHYSVIRHSDKIVRFLLESGANIDALDFGQNTPLSLTGSYREINHAKTLIDENADPRIGNFFITQAILYRSTNSSPYIEPFVTEMLDYTNNKYIDLPTGKKRDTLLIRAIDYNNFYLIEPILKRGANINLSNIDGNTPLLKSVDETTPLWVVKILIENGADILAKNKHGQTALSKASQIGREDIVKLINEL